MALVLRASLLSWIDIQLRDVHNHEVDAWLQILTNLSINLDQTKCDNATLGAWRGTIASSLAAISQTPGTYVFSVITKCLVSRRLF